MVELGLGLIQEGGMAACLESPRLLPGQLPDLDRYWVEAAIYMNDYLNTLAFLSLLRALGSTRWYGLRRENQSSRKGV